LHTNYKSTVTNTAMVRNFEGTCQRSLMFTESVCNVKLFTEINKEITNTKTMITSVGL